MQESPTISSSHTIKWYIPSQSSEKPLGAVRVTLLCKSNVCDAPVQRAIQDSLQETMWGNLNSDGIKWYVSRCFLKKHCIK